MSSERVTTVLISFARQERRFAAELAEHLRVLREFDVRVEELDDPHYIRHSALARGGLNFILMSPSLLASTKGHAAIEAAAELGESRTTRIIPILVRWCHWESTPLHRFLAWPRDGRPIATYSHSERGRLWVELVRESLSSLRFSAERVAEERVALRPAAPEPREIDKIFRTSGVPDITFVEPAQLLRLRAYLRAMGQGLVVEGPSGVGKTTIIKHVLSDLKEPQEWLMGQLDLDRTILDERLSQGLRPGHLIIDDFHRLDRARQIKIADAMKLLADRDTRDSKITLIGINPVGESLISALSELAGRFEVVAMGRQPDEKISELIQKGEVAANIVFEHREEFVIAAAGSFFTAQQICLEAALTAEITQTTPTLKHVHVGFRDVVDHVLQNLEPKYFAALRSLACHDERVPPRGACLALLWLLKQSAEGHTSLDDVHYQFDEPDIREAIALLKSSYLARCFDDNPGLKRLFYYNKQAGILSIEDPQLAFYLAHMSWARFIERTGHKRARIDAEGNLTFTRAERPQSSAVGRAHHVLHLSDLHFHEAPQAEVWYGQIVEDLQELGCDHVDALVLSGDITQTATAPEFEAAYQFVARLSANLQLSPDQIVIAPGNHDLSWPGSKAAYRLVRKEDLASTPPEGSFIAHGPSVVELRDEASYVRRFESFAEFYGRVRNTQYPLAPAEQFDLQDLPAANLLFLGLNSAWQIDHHFRGRAGIHPEALTRALTRIREQPEYADRLKIAVWHHPLNSDGEDRIRDHGFLQQLAKAGFRFVLHGHIHRAERGLFRYDVNPDGRRIDVVSAGTFGAPSRDWVPGFPLQYNLLKVLPDRVTIETRRREEPNGAWQPDARWLQGPGKDPLPRYEIPL